MASNLTTVTIPASLMGSAAIAFDTLSTAFLHAKDKRKLCSVLKRTAQDIAKVHGKELPKGLLIAVDKKLDILTDDVQYMLYFSTAIEEMEL